MDRKAVLKVVPRHGQEMRTYRTTVNIE